MYTMILLSAKTLFFLFISWTAISVGICAVLNTPLYVGHFSMHLLRIPDECIHDPLAFAIGVFQLVPFLRISTTFFAASDSGLTGLVRNWCRSFQPSHSIEKVRTLLLFFGLWLVVCPVLLGLLYCRFIVGISGDSPHWYNFFHFALADFGAGTLLLNLWASMCYFEMFTKRFWTHLVIGDVEAAGVENQGNDPIEARQGGVNNFVQNGAVQGDLNDPPRNIDRRGTDGQVLRAVELNDPAWQGKHGVIAFAFETMKAVTVSWEWDKVDQQSLLHDCAIPIARHLFTACATPIIAVEIIEALVNTAGSRVGATAIFRTFVIATIMIDSVISFKQYLRHCFRAAHDIARDDRYLVGEILLNFTPQ